MTDGPGAGFSWFVEDMPFPVGGPQVMEVGIQQDYSDPAVYARPDLWVLDADGIPLCQKAGDYTVTLHNILDTLTGVDTPATSLGSWRSKLITDTHTYVWGQTPITVINGNDHQLDVFRTFRTVCSVGDRLHVADEFDALDAELTDATVMLYGSMLLTYEGPAPEFGVYDTVFGRFVNGPSPDRAAQVNVASDLTDSTGRLHEVRAT